MAQPAPSPPRATAARSPPPPQILRRPSLTSQIHSAPASSDTPSSPDSTRSPTATRSQADPLDTPPPPPPLHTRRPEPEDDLVVPATPDSTSTSPRKLSFAEVVKLGEAAFSRKDGPHQPERQRLKSVIMVPRRSTYSSRAAEVSSHRRAARPAARRAARPAAPSHHTSAPRGTYYRRPSAMDKHPRCETTTGYPSHPSSAGHQGNLNRESHNSDFNSPERGWNEVRKKYWWRNSSRLPTTRCPGSVRREAHSSGVRPQASLALREFRRKTDGRCFVCLAPDHRAARCRDPVRCFRCFHSGHRERDCRNPPPTKQPINKPPPNKQPVNKPPLQYPPLRRDDVLPPPPPPSSSTAMAMLGDPSTRPDEDECLIPTSYAIDASLREWEGTAAVSWAMTAPPGTGPKEVEAALRAEFNLRHGEVTVTAHFPESFLIKFQHRHHCAMALEKGFAKRHGIDIHFIKWRSLTNALAVTLLFRVKLCLDGIPNHAWDAEIVERIIGRRCALETIETDLLYPAETKTVELWAWTANPCLIPKKVWLTFTSRTKDPVVESIRVSETPPERWQHGLKHGVIIHLEEIHDYTTSTVDSNGKFSPGKRRLPQWHLGVIDGHQVPPRAFEQFPHHPPPPRSSRGNNERGDGSKAIRGNNDRDGGSKANRRYDGRGSKGRYNNDHPGYDFGHNRKHHHDEDDDHYDDRGHGPRDARGRGRDYHGHYDNDAPVYRERSRSPRRRVWEHGGRRRGHQQDGRNAPEDLPEALPQQNQLQSMQSCWLQDLFKAQAAALQDAMQRIITCPGGEKAMQGFTASIQALLYDYINKACSLATNLGLMGAAPVAGLNASGWPVDTVGNEASSARDKQAAPTPAIPVSKVFQRLLRDIPAQGTTTLPAAECSIDAVDQVLQQLQLESPGGTAAQPAAPAELTDNMQQAAEPTSPTINTLAASFQALLAGVADFFANVATPIIQSSPSPPKAPPAVQQRRRRQRRVFDMSSEFVAMFNGPLPDQVIAALAEMFNLDDGPTMEINDALINMAGEGIADLQEAMLPAAT